MSASGLRMEDHAVMNNKTSVQEVSKRHLLKATGPPLPQGRVGCPDDVALRIISTLIIS